MYFRTEIKIDLDAIEHNYNQVRAKLPNDCKILTVIKADAYGHGAIEVAKLLDKKCDFFGIACIEEAVELKKAGIENPLLILSYVAPIDFPDVVKYDVRIPIFSYESAKALSDEAVRQNKTVAFHFCIDTGMSRIGFQVDDESADACKEITKLPNIVAEGLFSHYATADETDLSKANAQRDKYKQFVKMLEDRDVNIPIKHLSNSAGIMNFDECFDMCRMGIITYGLYPSDEVDESIIDLKPAMSWMAHITHIKTLEAGREISYGGIYKTNEPRVIATIPVGYADGYPRTLSNKGRVIINGEFAPVVGRVCMDQFMVDITDIPNVKVADEVVVIGSMGDKSITIEQLANEAGSFNYEQACRISRRVTRTYFKNGELQQFKNYLFMV